MKKIQGLQALHGATSRMLSVQKHTTNKTGLGYNQQRTFSKKTKFLSSKRGEPKKGIQKE